MVQTTNPKGAAKVEVVRIIPWLRVRILPVPIYIPESSCRMLDGLLAHAMLVLGTLLGLVALAQMLIQRRSPQGTAAWFLVIVLVPWLGVPLYLMLGGRKMREMARSKDQVALDQTARPAPPYSPIEGQLRASGIPPASGGNSLTLNPDGVAGFHSLVEMIELAESSIWYATFILGRDNVGRAILEQLVHKASEGVAVKLLLDGVGSFHANRRFLAPLIEAGGEVAYFMPLLHRPFRGRTNLRNHRKMTIVDGRRVWSGGCNTSGDYIGPRRDARRWTDLSFAIEGPAVDSFAQVFASDWAFATNGTPSDINARDREYIVDEPDQCLLQVVPSGPDVPNDALLGALLTGIYRAGTRIRIITPYFVPPDAVTQALCLAARRGVAVDVLVPAVSNHHLADWARGPHLRDIQHAGGRVFAFPKMIHAKTWLFDDETAMIGSANCDERSLLLNYEVMTVIYRGAALRETAAWIDDQFGRATAWRSPTGRFRQTGEGMAELVAPLI